MDPISKPEPKPKPAPAKINSVKIDAEIESEHIAFTLNLLGNGDYTYIPDMRNSVRLTDPKLSKRAFARWMIDRLKEYAKEF